MSGWIVAVANASDALRVSRHVNACYRGESSRQGWTTEADLLDGNRTDREAVSELIDEQDSVILLCLDGEELLASVHLKCVDGVAELGMLSVAPTRQGEGVGKWFLAEAEKYIRQSWGARKMVMTVITLRETLISFYERRGFRRTGEVKPFNLGVRYGVPRQPLEFEFLEKVLIDVV